LPSARAALKGVDTFRVIRRGDFADGEPGVLNEIRFVQNLFAEEKTAA